MLDDGESKPIDFGIEGREALFDDDLRYAVWEQADVDAFLAELRKRGAYDLPLP